MPLLVHLLRRRVTRRVAFPAVRFLQQAEREHSRERLLRNRLLLFLRLLAVLALVAAVARPMASIGGAGHPPTSLAIVIDQSMSTAAVVDGVPLFDALRTQAHGLIEQLGPDDRAWLVTSEGTVAGGSPAVLRAALDALEPSAGRGDLAAALERADALVAAGAPRSPIIAVLTDGQASSLTEPVTLASAPVVVWTPDVPFPVNRGVIAASADPVRFAPAGTIRFAVFGRDSTPWRVLLGDRTVARGVAPPASADAPTEVNVRVSASEPGWQRGRVEVDADEMAGDDRRHFAVLSAPPPVVVLRASAGPFVTAAIGALVDEGRLARGARPANTPASTSVAAERVHISGAQDAVPAPALLAAPIDPLQIGDANRALERADIPWRFTARFTDTVSVVAPGNPLDGLRVQQRYRLESRSERSDADSVHVVLAQAGGSPWAVMGPGYVVLASPLTPEASALPVSAAFVPWLLDALAVRLGAEGIVRGVAPGDSVAAPAGVDTLETPDGARVPVNGARIASPLEPGVYFFRRGAERVGALVVNPEAVESDVRQWGDGELAERFPGVAVSIEQQARGFERAVFARSGGRSVAWPLVVVALLALVAESLVARGVGLGRPAPQVA